jgi:hypothetical protein
VEGRGHRVAKTCEARHGETDWNNVRHPSGRDRRPEQRQQPRDIGGGSIGARVPAVFRGEVTVGRDTGW